MERFEEVLAFLPVRIRDSLYGDVNIKNMCKTRQLSEIRLRVNCPLILMFVKKEEVCNQIIITVKDIHQCLQFISDYSLYAHEDDVGKGFITLRGGHRAGLVGQAIIREGRVVNQNNIGFINIRVAYEVKGCADRVISFIEGDEGVEHTLIISPPACGKTTLLRDVIRQLSDGVYKGCYKVGVVDERSEIAACFNAAPQNDIGIRTDVINQVDKSTGMIMLLRSMAP
ncbi:MAG: stage III sporulation protein AA, partial [Lachnospira sp.]|nr:stage III sporulation protein AA [Lachnospira sp.]